jgi:hypothetical protein
MPNAIPSTLVDTSDIKKAARPSPGSAHWVSSPRKGRVITKAVGQVLPETIEHANAEKPSGTHSHTFNEVELRSVSVLSAGKERLVLIVRPRPQKPPPWLGVIVTAINPQTQLPYSQTAQAGSPTKVEIREAESAIAREVTAVNGRAHGVALK